jgi:type IV pilus assembly protein PilE
MENLLQRLHGRYGGMRRTALGMTLMELLVVIAVLAILASIAIPTYRKYLIRAQRTEAKVALLQLQTAQEKFYLQNNVYTDSIDTASPGGLGLTETTETGKYTLSVVLEATDGVENQAYTATATPREGGGQADDADCRSFTIDERGTRGVTGDEGVEHCWK